MLTFQGGKRITNRLRVFYKLNIYFGLWVEVTVNSLNLVCTAKMTNRFSTPKVRLLILFKEIIRVYSENHTKPINIKCRVRNNYSSKNPTLGFLVLEGGNVLGQQTGLWSTEAKLWGIVLKAAWHWGGDSSVGNVPSGHRAAPRRMYDFHPHGALQMVTMWFPGPCGTNMDLKKCTGKDGEGFS
jgi:hypothetical protein